MNYIVRLLRDKSQVRKKKEKEQRSILLIQISISRTIIRELRTDAYFLVLVDGTSP